MAKTIFITATNTDIGKTYTTVLLMKAFAQKGLRVGVCKPIETGVKDENPPDASLLLTTVKKLNKEYGDTDIKDITPVMYELPAAPFIASGGQKFDMQKMLLHIEKLKKKCDVLLIEGAGGLLVPIDEDTMMIDFIKKLDAPALLVTHCSLGCINDTLLSKKLLEDKSVKHLVAFNCKGDDENFQKVSLPYFLKGGFEVLKVSKDIDTICDVLYNL